MAEWDAAYISRLPDSAFAVIESGGEKDSTGRTTPRALRHLPHHAADGKVDLPHLRNALSRLPQTSLTSSEKSRALGHLQGHARGQNVGEANSEMNRRIRAR